MEIKPIAAIGVGILLVGSLAWAGIASNNVNNIADEVSTLKNVLNDARISNSNLKTSITTLNEELVSLGLEIVNLEETSAAQAAADALIISDYEAELLALNTEIETDAEEEIKLEIDYDSDEFGLAETFTESITENDYDKLLDSEVEFDGDDYDFEEVFTYTVTSDINGDDYLEATYLVVEEDGIEYKLVFDDDLDTSLISDDETLVINFLGEELEITSWDVDEITINKGTEHLLNVLDVIDFEGRTVELKIVGEDFVYVGVDGDYEKISEDETEKIGDLDIKLDFSLEDKMANLVISDADAETIIESGDEFAEDSIWEYVISANELGIKLVEDFEDIDEDSDYKALGTNEFIGLPNDYLSLTYNGINSVDMINVDFSEKDGFVKIKGDFVNGLDDYDLIYVDATGFYDEDDELITTDFVEIDDTDSVIELDGNTLVIDDVVLNLDFSGAEVNGNSVVNKDDNYRSAYGIIVDSPEDDLEDEKFSISVPEEEIEVTVSIN